MAKSPSHKIYQHQLPAYFYRFPWLIWPLNGLHRILHNRNRICLAIFSKIIRAQNQAIKVLDAGCGEGNYLIPLAHRFKKSTFYGLDYSQSSVDFIHTYAKAFKLNIKAEQADLNHPKIVGKYDLIICIGILYLLKENGPILSNFRRVIKNNGILVVNVPIAHKPIFSFKKAHSSSYETVQGFKAKTYTLASITQLLEQNGFRIKRTAPTNGRFGTAGNELLNFSIDALQNSGWVLKTIHALLFSFLIFPSILILNTLNAIFPKKQTSGLVIEAIPV